jgi:hypothetical protein
MIIHTYVLRMGGGGAWGGVVGLVDMHKSGEYTLCIMAKRGNDAHHDAGS